ACASPRHLGRAGLSWPRPRHMLELPMHDDSPPAEGPIRHSAERALPSSPQTDQAADVNSAWQESDRADAAELRRLAYLQQLKRTLGGFTSFAVSFSIISITTGISANFGSAYGLVGPAVVWSWWIAVAGQILVALVLAELAVHFPLSGYGYQWAARLV